MSNNIKEEQKNGKAANAAATVKAPPKTNRKATKKEPTLEERIQRVDELKSLTLKRQRTIETLHQIRTFSFASDENCLLSLRDSQNNIFETGNTNLIGLLKEYFILILNEKVSELDDEILAFSL